MNGKIIIKYSYNAQGFPTSAISEGLIGTQHDITNFSTEINPFLHKGYCYDRETGLYCCNTKYYDLIKRRWLCTDDISYLDPKSIGGINKGDSLKVSGTLYAGFGASLDFTKGIKAGLGFWEMSIEFDWNELRKWIIGGQKS